MRADRHRRGLRGGKVYVAERDLGPFAREGLRDRAAKPSTRAQNQCCFSTDAEIHHVIRSLSASPRLRTFSHDSLSQAALIRAQAASSFSVAVAKEIRK